MLIERKLSSKINYDVLRGLKAETKDGASVKSESSDVKKELAASGKKLGDDSDLDRGGDDDGGDGGCDESVVVYEDEPITPKLSNKR